jgi:hypothetical protein
MTNANISKANSTPSPAASFSMGFSKKYILAMSGTVVKLVNITIAKWRAKSFLFSLLVLIASSLKYLPLTKSMLELNFCKIEVRHTFGKKKSSLSIFSF